LRLKSKYHAAEKDCILSVYIEFQNGMLSMQQYVLCEMHSEWKSTQIQVTPTWVAAPAWGTGEPAGGGRGWESACRRTPPASGTPGLAARLRGPSWAGRRACALGALAGLCQRTAMRPGCLCVELGLPACAGLGWAACVSGCVCACVCVCAVCCAVRCGAVCGHCSPHCLLLSPPLSGWLVVCCCCCCCCDLLLLTIIFFFIFPSQSLPAVCLPACRLARSLLLSLTPAQQQSRLR
jgi:hypothetical protein